MKTEELLELPGYDPEALLDLVIDRKGIKNDAALARALAVGPPVLSKIRHKHLRISNDILVRLYDIAHLDLDYMRRIAGIPRTDGTMPPAPSQVPQSAEMAEA